MHEAPAMQRLERGQNRQCDLDRFGARQRTTQQLDGKRFSVEQFHGEEQHAVLFADFVELAHIGMVEAGRRPGLAPQPAASRGIAEGQEHLDGDVAA